MALMKCPECGKLISDRAAACPYCGNPISGASSATSVHLEPRKTSLSDVQKNPAAGVCYILFGIVCLISGLLMLGIIIGIGGIVGGFLCFGYAMRDINGYQTGKCPYCGNGVTVLASDTTYKCPHCKHISNHNGMYLETING